MVTIPRALFLGPLVGMFGLFLTVFGQVQTTTAITGAVRDATGAVIPGVGITVRNQDTGAVRETVTNDAGYYNVPSLRPGTYTISASLPGFKTAIVTNREALVAIPAQVNFTLEIGELSEQVTVSASGEELINKTTAELATTINQDLIENLPNQTRNLFDLLALAPNTSPQYLVTGNMSFGQHSMRRVNAANSFESSGVFAAGANDNQTNVSVDGGNSQIALYNQSVNIISSSAIKELRLQTASANAEFGYGSNAVNVITRSGTNEYHGEVFWQHRNDNLDAIPFFTNLAGTGLPEYKRNKFGASFGGPIIRDRLHFFTNYEGSRLRQAVQGSATVAPAEVREGDFSNAVLPGPGGTVRPVDTIYNPFDFDPQTGLRRPFPNNRIPANLLDPAIQKLLEFTVLPNTVIDGVPRYSGLANTDVDENQTTARVDYEISNMSTLYGRYTWAERRAFGGGLISPLQGENTPASSHNVVLNWTRLFGANKVNDFSASYSRPKWGIGRPLTVPDVSHEMGLQNTTPLAGGPGISGQEYAVGASGLFVWDPTQNTYQLKDDFSITRGNHSLKVGLHITERRLYFQNQSFDKGRFAFQPTFTRACPLGNATCEAARVEAGLPVGGLAFADFLLGAADGAFLEIRGVTWHGHQRYYGTYVQDTWQLHPRLTLNLGLRYEHWPPWLLPRNNTVRYDFSGEGGLIYTLQNPLDVFDPAKDYGRKAPLNPAAAPKGYEADKWNFSPRVGFSFTLTPDTTVRAAGGIFYAGNVNTNQFSDAMTGGAPFIVRSTQTVAGTEQLPPVLVRNQFPAPSPSGVPNPGEDPPASPRALGDLEYPTPTVYQWSFSVQHRFNPFWSASLDYLGSRTIHNQQFVDLNAPALPQGPLTDLSLQERRRFPQWGQWLTWVNWGYQNYHSGTLSVRNREWRGLSFMGSFIWAKNVGSSLSPIANDRNNFDFRNWDIYRGRALLTPTVRFIGAWSYNLPIGKGREVALEGLANALLGGWILSGITEFSTGAPATVTTSDNSGTGLGTQLADRIPGCQLDDAPKDRFNYFNTGCFTQPEFGRWGRSSIGLLNSPGINNWNMTLAKSFELRENDRLEVRLETYNTFNHTQWGSINTNLISPGFGTVPGTRPARQIQLALFYKF